jgi:hypothetical protein
MVQFILSKASQASDLCRLLTSVHRQRAIDIGCVQDEDEKEQAPRQAEDDGIIDTALAALLLQAIEEDLDARQDEAAREARRLHAHVFHAPKKQCIRRDIQTPEFAPWNHFENNNNGSDQSWFHCLGLSKGSFE